MDSLFDSIIPLLIILFYLFGNVFRKKGKKEAPPPTEPSYPQPDDQPPSLREEIRRRFEERARQLRGESEPEPPAPAEPEPVVVQPEPNRVSSVEATLRAQRARLTEVHRKAAEIKGGQPTSARMPQEGGVPTVFTHASIRGRLRSPKAVSEAIVLMEILGTPVGLRKSGEEMRPNFGS